MAVVYKEQNMVVPPNYISLLKLLVIKIIDTGGEIWNRCHLYWIFLV